MCGIFLFVMSPAPQRRRLIQALGGTLTLFERGPFRKLVVVLLNVALLIVAILSLAMNGFPNPRDDFFYVAILILVTPAVTLTSFLYRGNGEGWLALWIKR